MLQKLIDKCSFSPYYNVAIGNSYPHDSNYLGHVDIIEVLLDYGSLVGAPDNYGSTPLHLACQRGHQRATVSNSLHYL